MAAKRLTPSVRSGRRLKKKTFESEVFFLPTPSKILARVSSLTNSFIGSIVPIVPPTDAEVTEALTILGMSYDNAVCAYCGGQCTEWDHFRPYVMKRLPTGYYTSIRNLVPACGKCNQSKGNKPWKAWMSEKHAGSKDLNERVQRLEQYEAWAKMEPIPVIDYVGKERWQKYMKMLDDIVALMKQADTESLQLRATIAQKLGIPGPTSRLEVPLAPE